MADNLPDKTLLNVDKVIRVEESPPRFVSGDPKIKFEPDRTPSRTYFKPEVLTPAIFNLLFVSGDIRNNPQTINMRDFLQMQDVVSKLKDQQKNGTLKPDDYVPLEFWDGQVFKDFQAKYVIDGVYHPMLDAILAGYSSRNAHLPDESNEQYENRLQAMIKEDLKFYKDERARTLGLPPTVTVPMGQ